MSEQAQVGDTVRLTITETTEGVVYEHVPGVLVVDGWPLDGLNRTVEILTRATPPLPSEPETWWLGKFDTVWHVGGNGVLLCSAYIELIPGNFAPFRQLVLKSQTQTKLSLR